MKYIKVKRFRLTQKPTNLKDLINYVYDEDDEISWEEKARRLQARRWRLLKNQMI